MDLQPTLSGELLTLRPLTKDDFDQLFKAASDPLIWDQHPFPRFEKDKFTEFFDTAEKTKSALVIFDKKTKTIIGTSRYYDLAEDKVSIGYTFLARSHWGGGFNRELKTLMISHALKYVPQIIFDIGEANKRSRRAIEKIGARFVKAKIINEKPYTVYQLDQKDFLSNI